MAKTQTPKPTISDEQYKEMLAIRLAAMKGFEKGTVDRDTMLAARAVVRRARKVRNAEVELLESTRKAEEAKAEARSAAAKKAAATRAAKKAEQAS